MSKMYVIGTELVTDFVIFLMAFILSTGFCTPQMVTCGSQKATVTQAP